MVDGLEENEFEVERDVCDVSKVASVAHDVEELLLPSMVPLLSDMSTST